MTPDILIDIRSYGIETPRRRRPVHRVTITTRRVHKLCGDARVFRVIRAPNSSADMQSFVFLFVALSFATCTKVTFQIPTKDDYMQKPNGPHHQQGPIKLQPKPLLETPQEKYGFRPNEFRIRKPFMSQDSTELELNKFSECLSNFPSNNTTLTRAFSRLRADIDHNRYRDRH